MGSSQHMHKKFVVNWTKIEVGCQSERKVSQLNSFSKMPLVCTYLYISKIFSGILCLSFDQLKLQKKHRSLIWRVFFLHERKCQRKILKFVRTAISLSMNAIHSWQNINIDHLFQNTDKFTFTQFCSTWQQCPHHFTRQKS